jgi:hypothetical protein
MDFSWIFQNIIYFPSKKKFFDLIFFGENFNISTNNTISFEAAKVPW